MKLYRINGHEIWLMSTHELSRVTGIASRALRRWEKQGILPKPSVTASMYSHMVGDCERRLYTEEQARVLAKWVARVRPGKGVVIPKRLVEQLHVEWGNVSERFLAEINEGAQNE